MKRTSVFICILLAAIMLFSACGENNDSPEPTELPPATAAPEEEYRITHYIRYWPEDADYDSCDYCCIIELPEFSKTYSAGSNMNKAVQSYIEELQRRVEDTYMSRSVAEPPYTEVSCEIIHAGSFTNIIFNESHCYEAQPYTHTYVLLFDERGNEVNLGDVIKSYHADTMVSELIYNYLTENGMARNGLNLTDCMAAADVNNGVSITESAFTVYVDEGALAPYEYGQLKLCFSLSELLPQELMGSFTLDEYLMSEAYISMLVTANMVRESNVADGIMTEYAATAFMGSYYINSDYEKEKGIISVPKAEFEELYRSIFNKDFPGIDTGACNIELRDDCYLIDASTKQYEFHLDITDAVSENGMLILAGDVIYGSFGYANTEYVCHASLVMRPSEASPFGYEFVDYALSF